MSPPLPTPPSHTCAPHSPSTLCYVIHTAWWCTDAAVWSCYSLAGSPLPHQPCAMCGCMCLPPPPPPVLCVWPPPTHPVLRVCPPPHPPCIICVPPPPHPSVLRVCPPPLPHHAAPHFTHHSTAYGGLLLAACRVQGVDVVPWSSSTPTCVACVCSPPSHTTTVQHPTSPTTQPPTVVCYLLHAGCRVWTWYPGPHLPLHVWHVCAPPPPTHTHPAAPHFTHHSTAYGGLLRAGRGCGTLVFTLGYASSCGTSIASGSTCTASSCAFGFSGSPSGNLTCTNGVITGTFSGCSGEWLLLPTPSFTAVSCYCLFIILLLPMPCPATAYSLSRYCPCRTLTLTLSHPHHLVAAAVSGASSSPSPPPSPSSSPKPGKSLKPPPSRMKPPPSQKKGHSPPPSSSTPGIN